VFFSLSRHVVGPHDEALARFTSILFNGVPLQGRSLLDVGGGSGLMSFYAATRGASPVTCLEPAEAGSNPTMDADFAKWQQGLGDVNVDLVRKRFQDLDTTMTKYDVVLINSAINHMDEDACKRLPDDREARARYLEIFASLAELTKPGGDLIIADAARKNAWGALGLRSPFAPSIEWEIHAQPSVWAELATEAGFSEPRIAWRANKRLGAIGQRVLGNVVGGWLTNSMFVLQMRRAV